MHQLRGSRVRFAVLLLSLVALHSNFPTKAFAQGNFLPAVQYGVGTNPSFIISSDFNGDGKLDFAVANQNNNNVSVLLGNGGGTYQPAVNYSVGSVPISIAVGDFNRDGEPDLAVANDNSASISVLLGNGDGTFQSAVNYPAGSTPASVVVGDFNADGKLDLAVANTGPSSVTVLLGNGNGTFQAGVSYAAGGLAFSVAVGDFNGDGKLDLATANFSDNNVSVLLGNGNGTFQAPVIYAVGTTPIFVAIGDLNGDGKPDMVVANANTSNVGVFGNVSVLLGNGDGSFQTAVNYPADVGPQSVAIEDFNGDGKVDLAVSNSSSFNVTLLYGKGDGTFQTGVNYATGGNPKGIAVGDFSGDGRPDLAVTNFVGNNVSVLINNVLPTTPVTNGLSFDGSSAAVLHPQFIAVGDINRDGVPDLAILNNQLSIMLGNKNGTFQPPTNYPAGVFPLAVALGDFNLDGKIDAALADSGSDTVKVLLGNGNGTFQHLQSFAAGAFPIATAVGDLNSDGKPDLVVVNGNGNSVSILLGNGDATFQPKQDLTVGTAPFFVVVGDLNGDGKQDLVITNLGSNTISVLLGMGDGTFVAAQNFAVGVFPRMIAIGDLNGDGNPDLAVTNSDSGTVSILLGNGNGTFQPAQDYPVAYAIGVAIADYNGDGIADLAITGAQDMSVLLGNGNGTFQPARTFVVGNSPISIATADFNQDGKPDLVVGNMNSNDVSVLLNAGGTSTTAMSSAAAVFGQSVDLTATIARTLGTNTPSGTVQFQKGATNFGSAVSLSGSNGLSTAVLSTSALSVGTHIFTALYSSDANFWTNTAQQITQVVNQASTTTTVSSLNSPSTYKNAVTLKASVSVIAPGGGTPTGTVQFKDGATNLGAPVTIDVSSLGQLLVDGTAIPFLTLGTRSITAVYSGDSNYTGSTSPAFSQVVNKIDPVITWSNPTAITYGAALSAAQLNASANIPGAFVYNPASGAVPNAGTQTLSVTFTPTDVSYNTLSPTVSLAVSQAALNVTANSKSRVYGAANPVFDGVITGIQNNDAINASYTSTATTTSSVGSFAIVPTASGAALGNYTVALTNGTLAVTQTTSVTAVGLGTNPLLIGAIISAGSTFGTAVTFTAKVSSTTTGLPTGVVTFKDGSSTLGTGSLDSAGLVTFSTSTLAVGSHTITAVYTGDTNFTGSTSPSTLTVNVGALIAPDYTIIATPSSATLKAGQSATFTLTVTPLGGFHGPITFSCAGLPALATCVFSPSTVTPNGGPVTSTLTVTTAGPNASLSAPAYPTSGNGSGALYACMTLSSAGMMGIVFAGLGKGSNKKRLSRKKRLYLLLLFSCLVLVAIAGCGGGNISSAAPQTPQGNSIITVTATAGATGSTTSHTSAVTINIIP